MYQMYRGVSNYSISPCARIFRLARGVRMQSLWWTGYGHGPPERCVIWQFGSTRLVPPELLGCISCISGITSPLFNPHHYHHHHPCACTRTTKGLGSIFFHRKILRLMTMSVGDGRWKPVYICWEKGVQGAVTFTLQDFLAPGVCLTPCMCLLYTDSCRANLPQSFLVDRSRRYFLCICICIYECMRVYPWSRESWWGQEFPFCGLKTKHTKRKPSGLGFPSIRIKGAFHIARAAILVQRLAWNTLADRWPDTQLPSTWPLGERRVCVNSY